MSLLESEAGKRRLLSVEIPVIERYNEGRDPDFRIRLSRSANSLVLRYALKPAHNVYLLETRLVASYPTVPPETRVLTPLKHCPHLLEGQTLCLWRQGSTRALSRWDPRSSRASSPSRPPGAGWRATRSGMKPANGLCPRRSREEIEPQRHRDTEKTRREERKGP